MNKKKLLADALCHSGLTGLALRLLPRFRGVLRILAYHRVLDIEDEDSYPFDPELVSASTREFRWQMSYLKARFSPMSFSTFMGMLERGEPVPSNAVIVTFDDGFEDNYSNAYPILRDLEMPATIFLSTGYIGGADTYWFETVANCIYRLKTDRLRLPMLNLELDVSDSVASRRQLAEDVVEAMKVVPEKTRIAALEDLLGQHPNAGELTRNPLSRPMSWEQVREMAGNGMEFGSHTVSHPVLSRVEAGQLEFELHESRKTIQEKTGQPADVIAYPVGGQTEYSDAVMSVARNAGYRMGVSYISGINPLDALREYELRRIHVERYTSRGEFQAALLLPKVFG